MFDILPDEMIVAIVAALGDEWEGATQCSHQLLRCVSWRFCVIVPSRLPETMIYTESWIYYAGKHGTRTLISDVCKSKEKRFQWGEDITGALADSGRFDDVKWAYEEKGYALHDDVLTTAARAGDLDMVQWAHTHDGHWNSYTIDAAVKNGHAHVAAWLIANGCPTKYEKEWHDYEPDDAPWDWNG